MLAPATSPACWDWSVCVCARVCMQQFDQRDTGLVVVCTLVLTRCADHILSAYSPLSTSFPRTQSKPAPLTPQQQTVFICDARYFLCFFFFTVPFIKALL